MRGQASRDRARRGRTMSQPVTTVDWIRRDASGAIIATADLTDVILVGLAPCDAGAQRRARYLLVRAAAAGAAGDDARGRRRDPRRLDDRARRDGLLRLHRHRAAGLAARESAAAVARRAVSGCDVAVRCADRDLPLPGAVGDGSRLPISCEHLLQSLATSRTRSTS